MCPVGRGFTKGVKFKAVLLLPLSMILVASGTACSSGCGVAGSLIDPHSRSVAVGGHQSFPNPLHRSWIFVRSEAAPPPPS